MSSAANIFVAVRVRPQNESEIHSQKRNVIEVIDDRMLVFDPAEEQNFRVPAKRKFNMLSHKNKDVKFAFDRVFGPECTNADVFEQTSKPLIAKLLDGYNCSVFAYGATGAGKTHTMLGSSSHRGIMYHTMVELFEQIDSIREEKAVEVTVSYLEIYNEQIKDLLNPGNMLPIREGADGVAYVTDLSMQKPRNADEVFALLEYGNANRTQHPTDANAESSRSHALFQVYVRQKDKAGGTVVGCHVAKLSLIDLAGSERAIVTRNRGARFREGANINRSLLALGNCINALAEGKSKFVNYRDSKLTRLLKDSLGGNCYTVMIAAASPSALWFDDTHNTLQYANRAKNIKVDVTQNVVNVDARLGDYRKIISEQRDEIARLREEVSKLRGGTVALSKQGANDAAHALQTFENVPDRCRAETRRLTDKLFDLFNQLTKSQQECDRLTALRMDRMRQAQNLMMLASSCMEDHSLSSELQAELRQAREAGGNAHKAAHTLLQKLDPVNMKIDDLRKAIEHAQQTVSERTRLPDTLISSTQLVSPQMTACRNLARQAWEFNREICQSRMHGARLECELRCLKTETGMLRKRQADSDAFIRCILESIARQRSVVLTTQARTYLLKPASFTAPSVESFALPNSSSYWLPSEGKRNGSENAENLMESDSEDVALNRTVTLSSKSRMNRSSSCSRLQQQNVTSVARNTQLSSNTSRGLTRSTSKQTLTTTSRLTGRSVVDVSNGIGRQKLNRSAASTSNLNASPFKRPRGLQTISERSTSVEDSNRVRKTPQRVATGKPPKPPTPSQSPRRVKVAKSFRDRIFPFK